MLQERHFDYAAVKAFRHAVEQGETWQSAVNCKGESGRVGYSHSVRFLDNLSDKGLFGGGRDITSELLVLVNSTPNEHFHILIVGTDVKPNSIQIGTYVHMCS